MSHDNDDPNINNAAHDRREKWDAQKKQMDAQAEEMDAEKRMKYNDGMDNFSTELDAAGDWTEAQWDQFTGKVSEWWNEGEIKTDEAI